MLDLPMFQVMDTVDNVTKDCLSNCEDQVNDLFVTTSNYPNRKTFKDREEFCILGKKLLTATCKFPKRLPLTADFPDLCETLESLPDFLLQCKNNRSDSWRLTNKSLLSEILEFLILIGTNTSSLPVKPNYH